MILVCLCFALFYPNIGSVLSYVGAICGFVIIYLLPVMVYLSQKREEIDLTLRGQLPEQQQDIVSQTRQAGFGIKLFSTHHDNDSSQMNVNSADASYINDDDGFTSVSGTSSSGEAQLEKQLWRSHYLRVAAHSLIPLYGLGVLLLQFS